MPFACKPQPDPHGNRPQHVSFTRVLTESHSRRRRRRPSRLQFSAESGVCCGASVERNTSTGNRVVTEAGAACSTYQPSRSGRRSPGRTARASRRKWLASPAGRRPGGAPDTNVAGWSREKSGVNWRELAHCMHLGEAGLCNSHLNRVGRLHQAVADLCRVGEHCGAVGSRLVTVQQPVPLPASSCCGSARGAGQVSGWSREPRVQGG